MIFSATDFLTEERTNFVMSTFWLLSFLNDLSRMDRQIEFVLFIHQFNTGARTNTHTSATNKQKLLQDLEKEGTSTCRTWP